jgi:peptide/nickel transport system substrate-binding protein
MRRLLLGLCLAGGLVACSREERAPGGATAPPSAVPAPTPSPSPRPVLGFLDESGEGPASSGGVLRRRLFGEPSTLNAILQTSATEAYVLQYIQRNLLDFDARMNLVPGLAERWEVSADGRDYTFTLRGDAVWEDGTPVTSRDAVFTIEKIVDPKVPAAVFKPVFEGLESVRAIDSRRFVARFREPYAFRAMAFVVPLLPEHRFARSRGRSFSRSRENRSPLSNGPYRLVSWKAQESLTLERNPRYWGPPGRFDGVVFRIVPDDTTAYRMLREGELDEDMINTTIRDRAIGDPAFGSCCRLVEFYTLDYNYIALNNRSPFFADARVRRAMTMLLDRASIVRNLYKGSARIISGPWAPDSPAYDASVPPLPFDPGAAAALLDEAGWRDRDGDGVRDRAGRQFAFDLLVSAGSAVGQEIDEMLASELARVGVRARVRSLEWGSFVERVDAGDFEAASLAWSSVDPNPDPYPYWDSSQCPPNGLNDGCYRNPEADRLMAQARRESDPERRREIYHRLHRIFRDDAPAIFVVNASQKYAFRKAVRGLVTSPLGLFGIWPGPLSWWLAPAAAVERPAA